jgi:flagellar basal body-associated protein FliL
VLIILCTLANVILLAGSIQTYRVVRNQVKTAEAHANNSANAADAANSHAYYAQEQAVQAEEYSKETQHFAGVRLVAPTNFSGEGSNIGKKR